MVSHFKQVSGRGLIGVLTFELCSRAGFSAIPASQRFCPKLPAYLIQSCYSVNYPSRALWGDAGRPPRTGFQSCSVAFERVCGDHWLLDQRQMAILSVRLGVSSVVCSGRLVMGLERLFVLIQLSMASRS